MRWWPVALLALFACGSRTERIDPAAGHALLDEYVATFEQVAKGGSLDVLLPLLADQETKGDSLKASGKLSAAFADRHRRLIDVTRAVVAPNAGEAERQTVRAFLEAVVGKKEPALGGGLAEIAPALIEEVVSLHMLLDGTTDRKAARARYLADLPR